MYKLLFINQSICNACGGKKSNMEAQKNKNIFKLKKVRGIKCNL